MKFFTKINKKIKIVFLLCLISWVIVCYLRTDGIYKDQKLTANPIQIPIPIQTELQMHKHNKAYIRVDKLKNRNRKGISYVSCFNHQRYMRYECLKRPCGGWG